MQARLHANAGEQPGGRSRVPRGPPRPLQAAAAARAAGPLGCRAARPALGAALPGLQRGPRPPPAAALCAPGRVLLGRLSPSAGCEARARRRTSPPGPRGAPSQGFGGGRAGGQGAARGERGGSGGARARRPLRAPLPPPSGPGARSPCGRRGAPWRRGGRARAPPAGAAAPPPSPGLARPRCGAARQQAPLWASVHSRPAPGLEGPGPGAEPLSEGRASSAPPPHLQAGPGGAGFLVLSRPGAWGLGAPRASERGAASRDRGPLTPCEAWPASPHPAPAAWGRGRRTAAPSVRPARQRGAAAGPRPAALGPGTAGAWGPPARSQGSSARGRRSWNWVGASGHRASARLLRRALAKRFLSRGHTRNGGCGGQRMCSWAWTSSPASRAPEGARGPLLRLT